MENSSNEPKINTPQGKIIQTVSLAPLIYLGFLVVGSFANYYSPITVGLGDSTHLIGVILLILGPALILWSQQSIRNFRKEIREGKEIHFDTGPYRFTRNPTYLGLAFLTAGFGFIADGLPIIVFSFLGFVFVNYTVLRREENLLKEKYGESYNSYRQKVRRWM